MPLIPLKIPPGIVKAGTDYEAKGRWVDGNLIRWNSGAMQSVGGWAKVSETDPSEQEVDLNEVIRGMAAWRDNSQIPYLAMGTPTKAYVLSQGVLTDITPAGFTTGNVNEGTTTGDYGDGNYGSFAYGVGNPSEESADEANTWQFDSFGELLVGVAYSDGKLYAWDLNVANNFAVVDGTAPTSCRGLVVTAERFLVALAAGGDGRKVQWSDQEDHTTWTTASDNQAGDFLLAGTGELLAGKRGRNETLLWTDTDLWAMRYIGGTLVYAFTQLGQACGAISRRAMAMIDGKAVWMGRRSFFIYDGFVKPLPSTVADHVFSKMNRTQLSKVAAVSVSEWQEVWWVFPSNSSLENDTIVIYNYNENHWSLAELERTDGVDRGAFPNPIMADSGGAIYSHEEGTSKQDPSGTDLTPYIESSPIEIGNGDQVMMIRQVYPDERNLGDTTAKLFAALYPTATESSQTISLAEPTMARLTGRQVRLRIEESTPGWRVGVFRLDVVPGGLR